MPMTRVSAIVRISLNNMNWTPELQNRIEALIENAIESDAPKIWSEMNNIVCHRIDWITDANS